MRKYSFTKPAFEDIPNIRVISLQPANIAEQLLTTDVAVEYDPFAPMRKDKTKFYEEQLNSKNNPFYSFAALTNIAAKYIKYPIQLKTIAVGWSSLMGYYRLHRRWIVELDIPLWDCVIGDVDSVKLGILKQTTDCNLEVVTSELRKEWVREIYKPSRANWGTYEEIEYTPLLRTDETALFRESCCFSGSGVNVDKHLITTPLTGHPLIYSLRKMDYAHQRDLLHQVYEQETGEGITEKENNDWYVNLVQKAGEWVIEYV